MIDRQEILALAAELSLAPEVVEKDYVLGWILAAIQADPQLAGAWVFKGGTCLKKCFFETYRFSEDLDFTVQHEGHLVVSFLVERFTGISGWLLDASGIDIPAERLRFEVYRNKRGGLSCEGRLYYRGPLGMRGDLPRVKLDLTCDEVLVLPAVDRPISHPYSDLPAAGMQARCYAFPEIFAEKTRALGERSRPRDLYDVVNLYRRDEERPPASVVLDVLRRKCGFKRIELPTRESIAPGEAELRADWEAMLRHQLQALPPFESYWDVLPEFFEWLATGAAPVAAPPAPLNAEERVIRPALGSLGAIGIGDARELETIRFAASSRLCVDLGYKGTVRRIEPYSLRRTADGSVLLMAVRVDNGESRSYRVDGIQSVSVTRQSFTPRYTIELASAELAIRPLARDRAAAPTWPRPARTSSTRAFRSSLGPTYVFQCPLCRKKFNRSSFDSTLNPHKMPSGIPCSGRLGILVSTRP